MQHVYKRTYCLSLLYANTELVFEEELDTRLCTTHIRER